MRLVALLVTGCAGSQATTSAPVVSEVPASVAKLFVQGTKWTFASKRTVVVFDHSGEPDAKPTETVEVDTLICEVSFAGPRPNGRNARLTCSAKLGYMPMEFAATRDGLWQLYEESATLDPKARLLDEPPHERASMQEFAEGASTSAVSSEQPGRWCVRQESGGMGQSGSWMFCVRDGTLVGGNIAKSDGTTSSSLDWGEHDIAMAM